MKEQIFAIIKSIKNGESLDEKAHLVYERVLSSLELLQLIAELEKQYGVKIPLKEVRPENFDTIDGIEAMMQRLKA